MSLLRKTHLLCCVPCTRGCITASEATQIPFTSPFLAVWLKHLSINAQQHKLPKATTEAIDPSTRLTFKLFPEKELMAMAIDWRQRAQQARIEDLLEYCGVQLLARCAEQHLPETIQGEGPLDCLAPRDALVQPPSHKVQLMALWLSHLALAKLHSAIAEASHLHKKDSSSLSSTLPVGEVADILHTWLQGSAMEHLDFYAHRNDVGDGASQALSVPPERGLIFSEQLLILHVSIYLVAYNLGLLNVKAAAYLACNSLHLELRQCSHILYSASKKHSIRSDDGDTVHSHLYNQFCPLTDEKLRSPLNCSEHCNVSLSRILDTFIQKHEGRLSSLDKASLTQRSLCHLFMEKSPMTAESVEYINRQLNEVGGAKGS